MPPLHPVNENPNRQEFLESSFPASYVTPTSEAVRSASANDEKALEKEEKEGKLVEPKLNVTNTAIKWFLDQTVGCAVNTFLFSLFMHSIHIAMDRPLGSPLSTPDQSVRYLLGGHVDYGKVDWGQVVAQSQAEFADIVLASWKLWPIVSVVNFAFVKSVQGRNLLGSLAGVVWGIYMSLFAAR